jgi:hypothetical protein
VYGGGGIILSEAVVGTTRRVGTTLVTLCLKVASVLSPLMRLQDVMGARTAVTPVIATAAQRVNTSNCTPVNINAAASRAGLPPTNTQQLRHVMDQTIYRA